jgi:aspartate/methionine/tyrosine aminotransferase
MTIRSRIAALSALTAIAVALSPVAAAGTARGAPRRPGARPGPAGARRGPAGTLPRATAFMRPSRELHWAANATRFMEPRTAAIKSAQAGRTHPLLDLSNGYPSGGLHPQAFDALRVARAKADAEGHLLSHSKYSPLVLRELAVKRLFNPVLGRKVDPDHVGVVAYSSTHQLTNVFRAVSSRSFPGRPRPSRGHNVIVALTPHFKAQGEIAESAGLGIHQAKVRARDDARIDIDRLRSELARLPRGSVRGFLLTPDYPFPIEYSPADLRALGKVVRESGAPLILDLAFAEPGNAKRWLPRDVPIEQTIAISTSSKMLGAPPDAKVGVVAAAHPGWLKAIKGQYPTALQPETTEVAAAVLRATPESHPQTQRAIMRRQQRAARARLAALNERLGFHAFVALGRPQGPFLNLAPAPALVRRLRKAGITDSLQLADALHISENITSVPSDRMGGRGHTPWLRLNVMAMTGRADDAALLDALDQRLERFARRIERDSYASIAAELGLKPLPRNAGAR